MDKTIRLWNPTIGQHIADSFQGHTASVNCVAYSPNGSHIVSGSDDKTIRIWNPTTGQCIAGPFQGHTEPVGSVAYSYDGSHIVSGAWDDTIRVWNPTTGQCIAGPFQGHRGGITCVAYSSDGSHIISGSDDKTIRVWNPTTGQCIAGPFQGHTAGVWSVAYSPDGSQFVSGSGDNTVRIWNPATGQCLQVLFKLTKLMIFPSKCALYKDLLPLENCINKKMAGLSSLMVYVCAGSLLGLGMLSIFQSILWLYHDIKLTNLTLVISRMGSLGFPVGNNFNCSIVILLSPALFLDLDTGCCACFLISVPDNCLS